MVHAIQTTPDGREMASEIQPIVAVTQVPTGQDGALTVATLACGHSVEAEPHEIRAGRCACIPCGQGW